MAQQIIDAAFALAKEAHGPLGHAEAKTKLQKQFPSLTFDAITEVYLKASDLADACYSAGDDLIRNLDEEKSILVSLERKFPGFSKETYRDALNWGLYLAK